MEKGRGSDGPALFSCKHCSTLLPWAQGGGPTKERSNLLYKGGDDMVHNPSFLVLIIFAFIILASAVKICPEYERAFVFRLGRLILPPRGPGVFLIIPIVDRMIKVNLRSEKDLEAAERLLEEAKTQKTRTYSK